MRRDAYLGGFTIRSEERQGGSPGVSQEPDQFACSPGRSHLGSLRLSEHPDRRRSLGLEVAEGTGRAVEGNEVQAPVLDSAKDSGSGGGVSRRRAVLVTSARRRY